MSIKTIIKCDRCGAEISESTFDRKGAVVWIPYKKVFSLCDKCQKALITWLRMEAFNG